MNEKNLKQLTALAAFLFAFFCILWIALTYIVLPVTQGQKDYSVMITSPGWSLISLSGLLASIFGIFAVFGIYHTNREPGGKLLFIGIVLLFLGLILEFASLTWDTFIWPVVCASDKYISFVKEGIFISSTQFSSFVISLFGLLPETRAKYFLGLAKRCFL